MSIGVLGIFLFVLTLIPFVYYGLSLFSSWNFFRSAGKSSSDRVAYEGEFTPRVSILKPVRGSDPEVYENFASLCVQDYPDYEIVFCIDGPDDPVYSTITQLRSDFPDTRIRVLFGSRSNAPNDKVAKLSRLAAEAEHEYLVINDSDVRVRPDYLRALVAPLADPEVGAVTCFYLQSGDVGFTQHLQTISMVSEFYAGILTDWNLEGVKFTLGPTIATTRERLAEFGGYESIDDRPADDLLVGQLIAKQGYKVELLPYCIQVVADYGSVTDLLHKRLRWIIEMRSIRPWGHFGLLFTQGVLGLVLAALIAPSTAILVGYLALYLAMRIAMTWVVGIRGFGRRELWTKLWMIPLWDLAALSLWLASFVVHRFRWRGGEYEIRRGLLIPVAAPAVVVESVVMQEAPTLGE
ncbi:MAG TPA: glycosyltransferase [Candidatus Acidoferrales bacterium]|nr:glycosyltransferase [Candidatus Acidoferrales bacterium]